jgi:hypothetical protein
LAEWLKGLPVVLGPLMKIFFFPGPLQSLTAKQIGKPSLSMSLVVRTRLAERYFFLIIVYPFISKTSLDPTPAMASLSVPIDQEIGMD